MTFGDFSGICGQAGVPLCYVMGKMVDGHLLPFETDCSPRTVVLANTMVFNIGNLFIQLIMLIVIAVVAMGATSKYTAVCRREYLDLNYIFFLLTMFSIVVDSNVAAPGMNAYPYLVAVQGGLASALCLQLVIIGLAMLQLWEDGTRRATFMSRCGVTIWGLVVFVVSLLTFQNWAKSDIINPSHGAFLMAFLYVANAVLVFVYAISCVWLTAFVLRDWWAFGAYALAIFFFVVGQIFLYVVNTQVCTGVKHYVDGKIFATLCNMFTYVLMFKAWKIMTSEDLEFSVSPVDNVWDLKSLDDGFSESEYAMSHYTHQTGL